MKELFEKIQAKMAEFSTDATRQLENGNKAAGTRARKATLELTKLMKRIPSGISGKVEKIKDSSRKTTGSL